MPPLYGSNSWAVKARQMQRLEVFHNCCVSDFGIHQISAMERSCVLQRFYYGYLIFSMESVR